MGVVNQFVLKVKRGETPFYRGIKSFLLTLLHSSLPTPSIVRPFFRGLYYAHFAARNFGRWALNYFYREPLFRCRCTRVGKRLMVTLLPDVDGHVDIYIGD